MQPPGLAETGFAVTQIAGCSRIAAHRHRAAYAALVLEGEYDELSLDGRFACIAGHLVIHPPWHRHADEFGAGEALIVNIPLSDEEADLQGFRVVGVSDPQALFKLAERDLGAAGMAALEVAGGSQSVAPPAWMPRFMSGLLEDIPVAAAAHAAGITPAHASRVMQKWLGATPVELRREGRLRRAMLALRRGASAAEAAAEAGFADQPHLTRVLKAATGRTPARFLSR